MINEPATRRFLGLEWPARVSPAELRTLVAGGLGWMLDAMDVQLYALVLVPLLADFGMDKAQAGSLPTLTLIASAIGGGLFGVIADRIGRARALMASILVYSLASGACGFTRTLGALAVCRFVLGLGMGGEWSTGATLIAETWPARHRGKALGLMQSTYAIGEMVAAAVVFLILPRFGWRPVFWVGVLPALFTLWIRKSVPEPEAWRTRASAAAGSPGAAPWRAAWSRLFADRKLFRNTLLATAMNALGMFGYWGLFTWVPSYLAMAPAKGGRGLSLFDTTSWLLVLGVGKFLGYALFGFLSDRFGRRRCYVTYLLVAALLVPLYGWVHAPWQLLVIGPFVAFFGTGFFSGYSALAAELFPTEIRATAMGFTYNFGRGFAALAPFVVGLVADGSGGFTAAFLLLAAAYLGAAILAAFLPDAQARELTELAAPTPS
jgi:MFS family permease